MLTVLIQFGFPGRWSSRLRNAFCLIAFAGQVSGAEVSGADLKPVVGPPSGWVKPQFYDQRSAMTNESGTDQHWFLREKQINVAENETFFHFIRQIRTLAGVQSGANLAIDFNPNYQSLTFHWARVWRGADHLDRLDTNQIKFVRQEKDLDQFLLNGEYSAVLVMDDVRVGDVVDYAYSIKGENPVFAGKFSTAVPVQLDEPIDRLTTRLLWPAQRRLYAKAHGCSVQPIVIPGKTTVEYLWDLRRQPACPFEDSLPAWCDPTPWVQLSEFRTWAEVNQWALTLFQTASPLSPELLQKIAEWKRIGDRQLRALTVLRFVQDEVRYFGVEIGASSVKPADPSTVFARRFGDCKDKALLFVTILRALGIEAYPVLVSMETHRAVEDWHPTADAFDHCIATLRIDGQTYWVDPTAGYQGGSLGDRYLLNYERGLVISPTTTGLTTITQAAGLPRTTTTEYFRLGRKTESSSLKVLTVYEGRDADYERALFATAKRSDIEKADTHFYADLYPGIKMASPIDVDDDSQKNQFQTTEYYTIDGAWKRSDKDSRYRCDFYPSTIAALLKKPMDAQRVLPLGVRFPENQILRTEIILPEAWPADADSWTISDPAFYFKKDSRSQGGRIVMQFEYRSLADSVPPERMAEYLQRITQASDSLGYRLTWQ